MINYYQSKSLYSILLVLLYKMLQDRSFFLDQKNDLIKNRLLFIEGEASVKDLFNQVIENFVGRSAKFKQYLEESIEQIQEPNFSLSSILECIDNLSNKKQVITIHNEATV